MSDFNSGHRKRLRETYRSGGIYAMKDYQLLELLLMNTIPRKDVRPLAKELIEHFGSLENVLRAPYEQLEKIQNIGEITSTYIKLTYDINKFLANERLKRFKTVRSGKAACEYFIEMFAQEDVEKIAVMGLDNSDRVVNCRFVSEGVGSFVSVTSRRFITSAVSDETVTKVIIAHNHPLGEAVPSANDINFTLGMRDLLATLGVILRDHIIVGEKTVFSMHSSSEFKHLFKDDTDYLSDNY